jgi:hypothetical protein
LSDRQRERTSCRGGASSTLPVLKVTRRRSLRAGGWTECAGLAFDPAGVSAVEAGIRFGPR